MKSSEFSFSHAELLIKIISVVQPLQNNASKVYVLNLHSVTMEDAGEYICMAENPTGQTMQSAWLQVLPGKKTGIQHWFN